MIPYRSPEEEARHTARLKHAITIVFIAVNGCGEQITTAAVTKEIEEQCGEDQELVNMAFSVLASVMVGVRQGARDRAAGGKMKFTKKYSTACNVAIEQSLPYAQLTQDQLYAELQKRGWFWDIKASRWDHHAAEAADAPTDLIRVRVWAASDQVEKMADLVAVQMNDFGRLKLVEQSEPYPCRPPKQLESRVYLTFQRRER